MKNYILLILILLTGATPLIAQQVYPVDVDPSTCLTTQVNSVINEDLNFSIFPNPNDGKFYLTVDNSDYSSLNISIYNTFGQIVYSATSKDAVNAKFVFDISFISDGVYFIRIDGLNSIAQKRFIKL